MWQEQGKEYKHNIPETVLLCTLQTLDECGTIMLGQQGATAFLANNLQNVYDLMVEMEKTTKQHDIEKWTHRERRRERDVNAVQQHERDEHNLA